ncbi:hypothetical protein C5167_013083 [Papaver somniferum]|uniref:Secreted protein n=1 Tax=Papaver somniferum TaxID=3469 RepID=A0A4Y7J080_PAPSO|nr:hypothetical protein C5167_013083 [Papaver somniferum]
MVLIAWFMFFVLIMMATKQNGSNSKPAIMYTCIKSAFELPACPTNRRRRRINGRKNYQLWMSSQKPQNGSSLPVYGSILLILNMTRSGRFGLNPPSTGYDSNVYEGVETQIEDSVTESLRTPVNPPEC